MRNSGKWTILAIALLAFVPLSGFAPNDKVTERVENSTVIYKELVDTVDKGVPEALLEKARCVAVLPSVKKGAFIVGGRHGRGIISCRNDQGKWSPVGFLALSGGSFGFQIGGSSTDVVLFVMSERGVKSLLKSNFTLGADASVAAGPVGRSAEATTDARLESDIFSYARSKGLFAGIALDGASLTADQKAVERFYGQRIETKRILFDHAVPKVPAAAKEFVGVLP